MHFHGAEVERQVCSSVLILQSQRQKLFFLFTTWRQKPVPWPHTKDSCWDFVVLLLHRVAGDLTATADWKDANRARFYPRPHPGHVSSGILCCYHVPPSCFRWSSHPVSSSTATG